MESDSATEPVSFFGYEIESNKPYTHTPPTGVILKISQAALVSSIKEGEKVQLLVNSQGKDYVLANFIGGHVEHAALDLHFTDEFKLNVKGPSAVSITGYYSLFEEDFDYLAPGEGEEDEEDELEGLEEDDEEDEDDEETKDSFKKATQLPTNGNNKKQSWQNIKVEADEDEDDDEEDEEEEKELKKTLQNLGNKPLVDLGADDDDEDEDEDEDDEDDEDEDGKRKKTFSFGQDAKKQKTGPQQQQGKGPQQQGQKPQQQGQKPQQQGQKPQQPQQSQKPHQQQQQGQGQKPQQQSRGGFQGQKPQQQSRGGFQGKHQHGGDRGRGRGRGGFKPHNK